MWIYVNSATKRSSTIENSEAEVEVGSTTPARGNTEETKRLKQATKYLSFVLLMLWLFPKWRTLQSYSICFFNHNGHESIESTGESSFLLWQLAWCASHRIPIFKHRAAVMPSLRAEVPDDRQLRTTHHPDSPTHMDSWQPNQWGWELGLGVWAEGRGCRNLRKKAHSTCGCQWNVTRNMIGDHQTCRANSSSSSMARSNSSIFKDLQSSHQHCRRLYDM